MVPESRTVPEPGRPAAASTGVPPSIGMPKAAAGTPEPIVEQAGSGHAGVAAAGVPSGFDGPGRHASAGASDAVAAEPPAVKALVASSARSAPIVAHAVI